MRTLLSIIFIALFFSSCLKGEELPPAVLPEVTSAAAVTGITESSAVYGGVLSSAGNAVIEARGVCWSSSPYPTVLNSKTEAPGGLGAFSCNMTGLSPGTTYYARAFATNSAGTAYGEQRAFTTLALPVVSTRAVTSITGNSAASGGTVTASAGSGVTVRGVCWSTASNPTIALSTKTNNGSGTGSYTSTITGLARTTVYFVRAYATNAAGTAYGENIQFRTN